jgi:hypothetical protein
MGVAAAAVGVAAAAAGVNTTPVDGVPAGGSRVPVDNTPPDCNQTNKMHQIFTKCVSNKAGFSQQNPTNAHRMSLSDHGSRFGR